MSSWNPWHGCRRISAGCANCYVYGRDGKYGKDSSQVVKNADFDLPLKLKKDKTYKLTTEEGIVYTCLTSDFFIEEADEWREECWQMIKRRFDLHFFIITKRIHRFSECIPQDWGEGYLNVTICCTVENEEAARFRLPIYKAANIKQKIIVCEPLLGKIDLSPYLDNTISQVTVGGESGPQARICDYSWVLDIRRQCTDACVPFHFHQTGARLKKDGKIYIIPRKYQHSQAEKAGIDIKNTKKAE